MFYRIITYMTSVAATSDNNNTTSSSTTVNQQQQFVLYETQVYATTYFSYPRTGSFKIKTVVVIL